jgi:hypothetical protein
MHIRPPLLRSHHGLIALVAGVTWLALIGGVMSTFILEVGSGHSLHSLPSYAAYDSASPADTSFGTLQLTRTAVVRSGSSTEVDISMSVSNTQGTQADAPRFEDLRLLTSSGDDLKAIARGWNGPAVLLAHENRTIDFQFQADQTANPMWLEYRDPYGLYPIRIALGTLLVPQAALTGDQQS